MKMERQYTRRSFFGKIAAAAAAIGLVGKVAEAETTEMVDLRVGAEEAEDSQGVKPSGYHENWENFKRELREAIKVNKGIFPTAKQLRDRGYESLYHDLAMYHGGISSAKKKLGYG